MSPIEQALLEEGTRTYVNVPLIVQDRLIGSLNLGASSPKVLTAEHIDIACEVAAPLAIAIQQAGLHAQIQRHAEELEQRVADRTRELSTLYEVTAIANESLDLETTLVRKRGEALPDRPAGSPPQPRGTDRIFAAQQGAGGMGH